MKKLLIILASAVLMLTYMSCRPEEGDPTNDNWQNQHCTPIVDPQQ